MSEISGIDTKKKYVRVGFNQHGSTMIPFFEQSGTVDRNDDFWEECTTAITGEELRRRMYKRIDEWKWNGK